MPELIAFYEDHAEQREHFEVFAVHDEAAKSFAELDKKLASVKKQNWAGKNLPCPVLLDGQNKTHQLYGVRSWPTGVLIDPEGKVVGEASISALEAKLPALSVQKRWARHRDLQKNVYWSFEPGENTLPRFVKILSRWTDCPVTVDVEAVKLAGLSSNGPLPGLVLGSPLTLRSIEQLLLAPHGLGVMPSEDGNNLRITKRPAAKEPATYFQKLHARELNERLDHPVAASSKESSKALEFKNQPLLELIKQFGKEYDLPVALDAKAMQAGRIVPEAKVSGRIEPGKLRQSLMRALAPLGLTLEVRQEVVIVVPKK